MIVEGDCPHCGKRVTDRDLMKNNPKLIMEDDLDKMIYKKDKDLIKRLLKE